jgi:sRNA-binding protein
MKHGRAPTVYRDDAETIGILCKLYPKCFFLNPRQRRPLKTSIIDDIEQEDEPELAGCNIDTALAWYTGHIGYDYACVTGAERVDLDGKAVGKVTATEAREAQDRIDYKHKRIEERYKRQDEQMARAATTKVNGLDQSLESAIAALTKAREFLQLDNTPLRSTLLNSALSVASTSIQEVLKQTEKQR